MRVPSIEDIISYWALVMVVVPTVHVSEAMVTVVRTFTKGHEKDGDAVSGNHLPAAGFAILCGRHIEMGDVDEVCC